MLETILVTLRVAAGILMVLLVPGVPWTYVLLDRARISFVERIGIAVVLSIALVPLALFLLNILFGVPVDSRTTLALVLGVALTGTLAALWRTPIGVRSIRLTNLNISGKLGNLLPAAAKGGTVQLLVLALIMGFAFYTSMIPRLNYAYPLHTDEWTHFAEARTIATEGTIPFHDTVTGEARSDAIAEGTRSSPHFEVGYHLFLAEIRFLTEVPWLTIFRFLPSSIFALTVLAAYIFGRRRGFGLEAALFASLLPTTVRFLGPAFAVPVALGLLFVPLILFLVSHTWASRGLPALLLVLLSFLFIAHPPTALFASAIIVVHGLFQTVRPASTRRTARWRALAQLATVLVVVALSSLPPLIYNHWLVGTAVDTPRLPRDLLVVPGGIISRLGYFPYLLFVLGLVALARSRMRTDRALLVVTVLVALYAFLHYQYGIGNAALYARFILYLSMLVLLIAGLATSRVRRWLATSLSRVWARGASLAAAGLVVCVLVLPSVALGLQSRHEERYYHRIHDTEYQDFVWIRDHLSPGYERALTLPRFGRAFAAITGKYAYAPIPATSAPVQSHRVQEARQVLQGGLPDAAWLRERAMSIVYSQQPLEDPELVPVHDRVYVVPADKACGADGCGESVQVVLD